MRSECIERELPYSPEQLFDIAADVEHYPDFLRGWVAARIRERQGNVYRTDQILGLGALRIQFESETRLDRPTRIEVCSNDRAFRQFSILWLFEARPHSSCRVRLAIDLKLRSRLVQAIFERVAPDARGDMMSAFESRAHQLYGGRRSAVETPPASTPNCPKRA